MSVMQDAFTKAIDTTPADQQDTLRDDMSYLRNSWEQLNIDLNSVIAQLKVHIFQRIMFVLDMSVIFLYLFILSLWLLYFQISVVSSSS